MAWVPLDALGEDDPLFVFKRGLVHLIQDEFAESIENLERGIQINALYPTLNTDMQKFADKARDAMLGKGPVPATSTEESQEPTPVGRSADLSAYRPASED